MIKFPILLSSIRRSIGSSTCYGSRLTAKALQSASRLLTTKTSSAVSNHAHSSSIVTEGGILLSPSQAKDLFAGRFPTDCNHDTLVLNRLSQHDYKKIVHGFECSLSGREGKPSGYLVYGGCHSTSVLRAPPSNIHDALMWNIIDPVANALKQATRNDEKYSFQVMTNISVVSREKNGAMKIPDIRIARRERAPRRGKIPRDKIVFIAEIGFTESSSELEKCIKQWFKAMPEVKVAFLVKLDERPRFSSKRAFSHLPEYVIKNPQVYANSNTAASLNSEGVAEIHGVSFVGNISAFLEVWRRGPDGGAELSGERIKFYDSFQLLSPPKLELDTAMFDFSLDNRQHEQLVFDWVGWDEALRGQTGELARKRFFFTLDEYCIAGTEVPG